MRPAGSSSLTVVGIDPGAVCGIVVVGFSLLDVAGRGRQLVPKIRDARLVETAGMHMTATAPAAEIVRLTVLLASMHEATLIGLEVPSPQGLTRARLKTYAAQRELIGALRIRLEEWDMVDVHPMQAKKALADDARASKCQMLEAVKSIAGWERCWDTAQYRLEAKADAAGIALAAAKIWEKEQQAVAT